MSAMADDLDLDQPDPLDWRRLDDKGLAKLLISRGVRHLPLVVIIDELHDPDTHDHTAALLDRFLGEDR